MTAIVGTVLFALVILAFLGWVIHLIARGGRGRALGRLYDAEHENPYEGEAPEPGRFRQ